MNPLDYTFFFILAMLFARFGWTFYVHYVKVNLKPMNEEKLVSAFVKYKTKGKL